MSKTKKIYLYIKVFICFWRQTKYLTQRRIKNRLWRDKFYNLIKAEDARCEELLYEFLTCKMNKISHNKIKRKNKYSPILICVIKNDYRKIQNFMAHYRKLGVEAFIFLDNCSTDGTTEYLCKQKDTIVYTSSQEYSSARRVAWINRLLAIYGENRWCLVVDSDELVTFIGSEEVGIEDVIKKAIAGRYRRVEGFMLDMYSAGELFAQKQEENIFEENCYYDRDTYKLIASQEGLVIRGGPRKRVFDVDMRLSKYPLFYFGEEDIVASSHFMYPFIAIKECPVWFAICHYKFIDEKDLQKVEEAVIKENYASKSEVYKVYFEKIQTGDELSFYSADHSAQLINSNSLKVISFLKSPFT